MIRPRRVPLRERLTAEHVAVILGWVLVPLPVVGWTIAQSFTSRIDEVWEWSSAYVHALATSTFSVLFLVSAFVNLLVLIRRAPRRSRHATTRYMISQSVVIALALGWIVCLGAGSVVQSIEMLVGVLIAGASIVTLGLAATRSPESADSNPASETMRPGAVG